MLIVVMIIMFVMTIGTNTYRDQRKHVLFNDGVLNISNLIKTARHYTLTSRSVYDPRVALEEDRVYTPKEGYGIYIFQSDTPGESRVVLYANTEVDDDGELYRYDEIENNENESDLIVEEIDFPEEIDFIGLTTDKTTGIGGFGPGKEVALLFEPPYAKLTITVNDTAPAESLTHLNDLYMEFRRPEAGSGTNSHFIHINKITGFPEIERE